MKKWLWVESGHGYSELSHPRECDCICLLLRVAGMVPQEAGTTSRATTRVEFEDTPARVPCQLL